MKKLLTAKCQISKLKIFTTARFLKKTYNSNKFLLNKIFQGIHHGTSDIVKAECPPWARLGCFIGDGVQRDPHTFEEAVNVYRGCSSFLVSDDIDQEKLKISYRE